MTGRVSLYVLGHVNTHGVAIATVLQYDPFMSHKNLDFYGGQHNVAQK